MVKRKGKSWDGNFHKPAHRTFLYEIRRTRLFHTLTTNIIVIFFTRNSIATFNWISFREKRAKFWLFKRATWFDSFFAREKKKINFHRNLRRISSSLKSSSLFFLWNNFLTYINIELTEYKIFLFFFFPLHVKFRSSCSINSRVWNSCFLG